MNRRALVVGLVCLAVVAGCTGPATDAPDSQSSTSSPTANASQSQPSTSSTAGSTSSATTLPTVYVIPVYVTNDASTSHAPTITLVREGDRVVYDDSVYLEPNETQRIAGIGGTEAQLPVRYRLRARTANGSVTRNVTVVRGPGSLDVTVADGGRITVVDTQRGESAPA